MIEYDGHFAKWSNEQSMNWKMMNSALKLFTRLCRMILPEFKDPIEVVQFAFKQSDTCMDFIRKYIRIGFSEYEYKFHQTKILKSGFIYEYTEKNGHAIWSIDQNRSYYDFSLMHSNIVACNQLIMHGKYPYISFIIKV
jgi:hypothetical protein